MRTINLPRTSTRTNTLFSAGCCTTPRATRWEYKVAKAMSSANPLRDRENLEMIRTVLAHCQRLTNAIQEQKSIIMVQLRRWPEDEQPQAIVAAWKYALETMIQEASFKRTCRG
jgi:phosphatidylserine/phosphatidylglycerophosphate/cardiolipin synthase-like enzyme